ncbi:MAG TPA: IS1 family transposase, partial [Aurantimonas sp.]
MNKLDTKTRATILSMLVEGSSMRSISRITGVSINTVTKLLVDAGEACAAYHDEAVRGVAAQRVQCDEIWSFVAAKQKNVKAMKEPVDGAGDVWTWTALDADSKLIVSYLVGGRDS